MEICFTVYSFWGDYIIGVSMLYISGNLAFYKLFDI